MANASAPSANGRPRKTSSSCLTQAVTEVHNFEVINFSLLEGMGVSKFVSSKNFRVSGYDWNIRLYPDGATANCKGYISAFLAFLGGASARVRFSFCVLGKHGQVLKLLNDEHTFQNAGLRWESPWLRFVEKSSLQPLLHKNNDRFTIKCVLAARSPVFRAELFGPMKEKATRHIKIDDMEPSIFEALLHFIYTDSLPNDSGVERNNVQLQHLLVAADRYELDRLRLMCEVKMCQSIDAETGVLRAVMESKGFDHLAASCPLVLFDILDTLASLGI
ncbi:unnamed protein product [Urochloa decumbens]|uniref:Uncharacterized protein n=1 Tax=Urochloa decumbens TaxID=240449 RepID=A0ABC9D1P6_9POAL